MAEQDDIDGAQAAYQRAIDSGDEEIAPMAAVRLGTLLAQHGDPAGARPALQKAIDSGHSYAMPWAAYNLGILLAQQQDLQGALTALQTAVKGNNPEAARDAATLIAQIKRAGTLRKAVPAQLRNAFQRRRK